MGGGSIEETSVETGVSIPTIKRRLALATLTAEVKEAVRHKTVSLGVAEVLTLAPPDKQKAWLKDIARNPHLDARYLRSAILDEKPSAAMSIFPPEKYRGTFTHDLFAEKDTTFFDDKEQFMVLQRAAVEALAEQHRKRAAWVEVKTDHTVSWWQYRQARKKEPSGIVIHLAPTGRVEVRKGLVHQDVDPKATVDNKKTPNTPNTSKATYRYANAHKTLALQMALLSDARIAKEAVALLLLSHSRSSSRISLRTHDALRVLAKDPASSKAYGFMETTGQELLKLLEAPADPPPDEPAWLRLQHLPNDWPELRGALRSLTVAQLDTLISVLLLLCFGTEQLEEAERPGSLFEALSTTAGLSMRNVWTPDEPFLAGLRRDDLVKVAGECGALRLQPRLGNASKKELVQKLGQYFKRTADPAAELDEHEAKGRSWLPEFMKLGSSTAQRTSS